MKHYRSRSNLRRSRKPKSRNNRRRRTYRYRGGAAAGNAKIRIAALDAAFAGALGSEKRVIKAAVLAALDVDRSSNDVKNHTLRLLEQIREYADDKIVTAAMLSAKKATAHAAAVVSRDYELARNDGPMPNPLRDALDHSRVDPKSQPAKPASPKRH